MPGPEVVDLHRAFGFDGGIEQQENTLSFEIYPPGHGDSGEQLAAAAARVLHHLLPHLDGYVWQRDRFDLHPSTVAAPPWRQQQRRWLGASEPAAQKEPACLWGSLSFGDNVEDEWFATWLLMEATRAFPGLVARAWDNDGEFLLIEAAYALPRWLKPENAHNRLWLLGGQLHLLPLPRRKGDPLLSPTPSVAQALAAVRGGDVPTAAPPRLAAAVAARLAPYPGRARELMHRATLLVPPAVARLLTLEPQLVAAAVEAFHYRDLDDMKAASSMTRFPPSQQVAASVVFSRCLYAQLALQDYTPPHGYPLPLPSDPGYKAAELGMKLTAGFEMVAASFTRCEDMQQEQEQASTVVGAEAEADTRMQAYVRRTRALATPGVLLRTLLSDVQAAGSAASPLPPPEALPAPDSDAWLAHGNEQLDHELRQRQQEVELDEQRKAARRPGQHSTQAPAGGKGGAEGTGADAGFDLGEVSSRLRAFVDAVSGPEGAEAPRDHSGGSASAVSLHTERFVSELEKVLGVELGELELEGSGDEYGAIDSSDEGSSFYSGGSSDEDEASDIEGRHATASHPAAEAAARQAASAAAAAQQQGMRRQRTRPPERGPTRSSRVRSEAEAEQARWEVSTATDSDDEDAVFMNEYSRAMNVQLASTRVAESFERAPPGTGRDAAPGAGSAAADSGRGSDACAEDVEGEEAGMRPVDVDLNLVKSLLESYSSQAGMPGPASNLAGLLGIKLPDAEM